jgi:hypothetical protein
VFDSNGLWQGLRPEKTLTLALSHGWFGRKPVPTVGEVIPWLRQDLSPRRSGMTEYSGSLA